MLAQLVSFTFQRKGAKTKKVTSHETIIDNNLINKLQRKVEGLEKPLKTG